MNKISKSTSNKVPFEACFHFLYGFYEKILYFSYFFAHGHTAKYWNRFTRVQSDTSPRRLSYKMFTGRTGLCSAQQQIIFRRGQVAVSHTDLRL